MQRSKQEAVDTSPVVGDEIKSSTCFMCACRCGINVHLRDGRIRFIEGNPEHPINKGVLCAKGAAGAMQQYSPARLQNPLKRVGPRGSGQFAEISWDEALATASGWLGEIRNSDPCKLAFFTGRDQSQALTSFWASQFGTPNYAAHGGFCSVNMAAAGMYSIGGSFWEFGEPDWEKTKYFVMFGVAEDHSSNPIKIGLGTLKARDDTKFVSINPVRTGYSAIADEWIGITPGTDGLLVNAIIHELLRTRRVDLDYLVRYTNAPWLVRDDPGGPEHGLFIRDADARPLAWDRDRSMAVSALAPDIVPALLGRHRVAKGLFGRPVFALLAERYATLEFSPEMAAERTGIAAATIRRLAAELAHAAFEQEITLDIPWVDWAGRQHQCMVGRPVSMHAMRGISAHANGFQTCRAIHVLQMLLGTIDCPGGFRYKPPFPKAAPPGPRPAGKPDEVAAGQPLPNLPLGYISGPEDLLLRADGTPMRIDKAYSWDAPLAAHGLMHMVIRNAWAGDPYPIDTLFLFMANMSWNSAMNTAETMRMLTDRDDISGEYRIPHIIYSDAYYSEMVAYADLVLPDTTYLERWDCISLLDRPISTAAGPADAIRQPVLTPDRNVRPFQDTLIELGVRLGLSAFCHDDGAPRYPGGYADYIVNHERLPGCGGLAGWRGDNGQAHGHAPPNPKQLQRYIDNDCFWQQTLPADQQYYKHANRHYLDYAHAMGWVENAEQIILQLYVEPLRRFRLAAQGHGAIQPPSRYRQRLDDRFDPLPIWYSPSDLGAADYPLHAITQRPMAMYHSWGSQNAWLRQIHTYNKLYMHVETADDLKLTDDDWVWVTSANGEIRCQIQTMQGCNRHTVWTWNAIAKRKGTWQLTPGSAESEKGFLLNHLIADLLPPKDGIRYANADPITGQAAWFDLRVRIRKAAPDEMPTSAPTFPELDRPPLATAPNQLRYGEAFLPKGSWRRRNRG